MTPCCPSHLADVVGRVYHAGHADRRAYVRVWPIPNTIHAQCIACKDSACWEVGA